MQIPSASTKRVVKACNKFGFYEKKNGAHLILQNIDTNQILSIPRNRKEVSKGIIRSIIKDMQITEQQFCKAL